MKFSVFSLRISRRKKGKKIWKGLNDIQPETKLQNENKDRRENTERFKYNDLVTREKVITGLQSLRRRRKTKRNVDRRKNQDREWVGREKSHFRSSCANEWMSSEIQIVEDLKQLQPPGSASEIDIW